MESQKIILLGSANVGKTAILTQFVDEMTVDYHDCTIGIDFRCKRFRREGREINLKIWDTAGQERFRSIVGPYYRCADGIVLVYDTTNSESLEEIDIWMQEIERYRPGLPRDRIVLVGNKRDLGRYRAVSTKRGEEVAAHYGTLFAEITARSHDEVEDLFGQLIKGLPVRLEQPVASPPDHRSKCRCG
jgi:Ras-related protein Rab-1A